MSNADRSVYEIRHDELNTLYRMATIFGSNGVSLSRLQAENLLRQGLIKPDYDGSFGVFQISEEGTRLVGKYMRTILGQPA